MAYPLCSFIHRMTPLELVLVYRAYVESRVVSPELERRVCNYIRFRNGELNGSTALSLLFCYSRGVELSRRNLQKDVVSILCDEIHRSLPNYSTRDLVYLVCAFNHLRLFPEQDIDVIASKLTPHVSDLSPKECFYLLTCVNRARYSHPFIVSPRSTSSEAVMNLYNALLQSYVSMEESSIAITGVRCMLLRFAAAVFLC